MGLKGKLVAEFEVGSSAHQFFHQVRHKPHHISAFSDLIQDCELHGGEYGHDGSIICWRYTQLDGKACSCKQILKFDEETKTTVMKVIGGDVMEDCKRCVITFHHIAQGGGTDLIRLTIDYEKLREDAPHPVKLLDVILNVSKHIEVEHLKASA